VRLRRFAKSAAIIAFAALLVSCYNAEKAGDSIVKKAIEEKASSATGGKAAFKNNGELSIQKDGREFTVSSTGNNGSAQAAKVSNPELPPGGSITSRVDGVNDATFTIAAPGNLAATEAYYRAAMVKAGYREDGLISAEGLFRGRWKDSAGVAVEVFAYAKEDGQTQVFQIIPKGR